MRVFSSLRWASPSPSRPSDSPPLPHFMGARTNVRPRPHAVGERWFAQQTGEGVLPSLQTGRYSGGPSGFRRGLPPPSSSGLSRGSATDRKERGNGWSALADVADARDRPEHDAWMGSTIRRSGARSPPASPCSPNHSASQPPAPTPSALPRRSCRPARCRGRGGHCHRGSN